jgi:ABC-type lipoprotein release transport system permease subunit
MAATRAHAVAGIGASSLLAMAASAIPAWRASQVRVVEAVRRVA